MKKTVLEISDLFSAGAPKVIIAGYAGRDQQKVKEHIDELAALGVAPPENIPEFYEVSPETLTQESQIAVGPQTSGEAEPVLIRHNGEYLLTVGSDHTDRYIEASSVLESKRACAKPIAREALVFSEELQDQYWGSMTLGSRVDGAVYQDGSADLLPIFETLRIYEDRFGSTEGPLVLFGGTVPLLSGQFVYGREWALDLAIGDEALVLNYHAAPEESLLSQGA